MINIHMLVWGAKHIGPVSDLRMDADPATTWMNMALAHARQVRIVLATQRGLGPGNGLAETSSCDHIIPGLHM